ncbi:hypothetical protein FOZ63_027679 [Perkinsus olseni]|uniref:Uncharacterized protein n=1 Tax=Perkinsus olseni TaxID=32597 RepID=A0A7J6RYW3_PEROL|nr:hypothetical protein FOZ60_010502 [Perkinsus olseni]KAF4725683.1 hypothetical protein FOZ63_027679 [Perkinsus olseni]
MSIILGYLPCVLLLHLVVVATPSRLRSMATYDIYSEPPVPIAGESVVDPLAALLVTQVRAELNSSATKDYLPQGLAITAEDDGHSFWVSLAAQVREEFGSPGLNDAEILLSLASAVENDDDFLLELLPTETTVSSPAATYGDDLTRPQAAVARHRENPVVIWIVNFWWLLSGG